MQIDFDHIYWQLDAGFDGEISLRWKDFGSWLETSYKPGLTRLAQAWISEMKSTGKVQGLVPFLGIMQTLQTNKSVPLQCGIGHSSFSITTDGKIIGCPVVPGEKWNQLGDLSSRKPTDLLGKLEPQDPCKKCDILQICGGRCLIATYNRYWGDDGFVLVCQSIRHLISEMQSLKPEVDKLLATKTISHQAFAYPASRYSLEVIP